jgi:hypothetical protein
MAEVLAAADERTAAGSSVTLVNAELSTNGVSES